MRRSIMVAAVSAVVGSPAFAAESPPLRPTRDVAVVYRVEAVARDAAPRAHMIHMYWGDGGNALRVELDAQPIVTLIDFRRQRMAVLIKDRQVVLETKLDPRLVPGFVLPRDAAVVRAGTDTVAGLGCTVWNLSGPRGAGSACITGDGVLLRAQGAAEKDGSGRLEAVSVTYAPQPASLFALPPGLARMDLGTPRR